MTAEVTYIGHPIEWISVNDYDSHSPMLYLALSKIKDLPVSEFGCGYGSTPRLRHYCKSQNRNFFSYETNKEWAVKFKDVTIVKDYADVHLSDGEFIHGILFIDCAPGEIRKDLADRHRNNAAVIVIHDTEIGAEYVYGLRNILNTFGYRLDYKPEGKPHTTIVSDKINVTEWANQNSTSYLIAAE